MTAKSANHERNKKTKSRLRDGTCLSEETLHFLPEPPASKSATPISAAAKFARSPNYRFACTTARSLECYEAANHSYSNKPHIGYGGLRCEEMRPYLEDAFDPEAEFVINRYRRPDANMRTTFLKIIKRAGVKP